MSNNKFKVKRITVVSALCFSVLYTNTAFAVWPVTEEVLTPYLMGASPQSMGNGIIETLVSMNDKLARATIQQMRIRRMLLSVMPVRQSENSA